MWSSFRINGETMEVPDRNSSHTAYSFHPSWVRNKDLSGTAYPFFSRQGKYRITAWVRLEGTSWDYVVQLPYAIKVCWNWLVRTASSQVFNKSIHRHFTPFLDNVFQCLITLTVNFFIIRYSCIIFKKVKLYDVLSILSHLSDTKQIGFHASYWVTPFFPHLTFQKVTLFHTNFPKHWKQLES